MYIGYIDRIRVLKYRCMAGATPQYPVFSESVSRVKAISIDCWICLYWVGGNGDVYRGDNALNTHKWGCQREVIAPLSWRVWGKKAACGILASHSRASSLFAALSPEIRAAQSARVILDWGSTSKGFAFLPSATPLEGVFPVAGRVRHCGGSPCRLSFIIHLLYCLPSYRPWQRPLV